MINLLQIVREYIPFLRQSNGLIKAWKPVVVADIGLDDPVRGDSRAVVGLAAEISRKMGAQLIQIDRDTLREKYPDIDQNLVPRLQEIFKAHGRPSIVVSSRPGGEKLHVAAALEGVKGKTFYASGNTPKFSRHYCSSDELIAHHLTPDFLASEKKKFDAHYPDIKGKLVGVMLTGYDSDNTFSKLTELLQHEDHVTFFLCGCPRASASEAARSAQQIKSYFSALGMADKVDVLTYTLDKKGYNPYAGLIAKSDHLVISGYSGSMVSEGLAAGKTVHVTMDRHETKDAKNYGKLREQGLVKYIGDYKQGERMATIAQEPVNITPKIADGIIDDFKRALKRKRIEMRGYNPVTEPSWTQYHPISVK